MKKIITAVTALILSAFLFTACSSESLTFDGMYWNKSGEYFTFQKNMQEICTYSLSVEHVTEADKNVVKNDDISMSIKPTSYYETTLTAINDGGECKYKYTTHLVLNGSYTVKNNTIEFDDDVFTETLFKLKSDNFLPYYSTRRSSCSYPALDDDNGIFLCPISYEQRAEYEGDKVKATITPTSDEFNQLDSVKGTKEYKINKDTYIDNELITLLPRAFNLSNGVYQKFTTVDYLPNLSRKMIYSTMGNDNVSIANIGVSGYKLNGREVDYDALNATRVFINIDDTFQGAPIEVYYAKDDENTPHHQRMLLAYSRINSNIGYIKYTLKSTDTNVI